MDTLKHGDFTELADDYDRYRPGYSNEAVSFLEAKTGITDTGIHFADIGAGTGIWTRMMSEVCTRTVAVEPNDAMRQKGQKSEGNNKTIKWVKGTAENSGLQHGHFDLVTMASAFHWADFEKATIEFSSLLKPGGIFGALWNTRKIEASPLFVTIENRLSEIVPELKRVSSGRSAFCDSLTEKLSECSFFDDVNACEFIHVESMSTERYIGIWKSVNDVRVQAGPERFGKFIDFIEEAVRDEEQIEATYLTKLWAAKKAK